MSPVEIGLLMLVGMILFMLLSVHIGVALIGLSFVGIWLIKSNVVIATKVLSLTASDALANYLFAMVPMFVLLGLIVDRSRIGRDTFDAAQWFLARIPGGVGVSTVVANAIFAAITGISIASAALFTKVAVPQMLRLGYDPKFAVGAVAGSSVLGMLIPPSLLLMLYGIVTETSIGALFKAGIVPGLILAGTFCFGIVIFALVFPGRMMTRSFALVAKDDLGLGGATLKLIPSAILIMVILGGIYGGVFTVTEAAAGGAATGIILSAMMRRITWRDLWESLLQTGHIAVSVLFLILAAIMYSKMLAFSRIPQELVTFLSGTGLGMYEFVLCYILLLIVLGMILDSASIILVTVPLVLPVVESFGADLVWFGIVTVIAVEIGLLTPPFGLSVYVVKTCLNDETITLSDIFKGSFPFVIAMLIVLMLVVAVPDTALFL